MRVEAITRRCEAIPCGQLFRYGGRVWMRVAWTGAIPEALAVAVRLDDGLLREFPGCVKVAAVHGHVVVDSSHAPDQREPTEDDLE